MVPEFAAYKKEKDQLDKVMKLTVKNKNFEEKIGRLFGVTTERLNRLKIEDVMPVEDFRI